MVKFRSLILSDWLDGAAAIATLRRVKELGKPVVGLKLRHADCSDEDFSGLMLAEAEFENVTFNRANLAGALFNEVSFVNVSFDHASLDRANFFKCRLIDSTAKAAVGRRLAIAQSELQAFDATDAKFIEARFVQSNFVDVNLTNADLNTAAMVQTKHDKTNFSSAFLEQTSLFSLDLRTCIFKGVNGPRIVLTSSNLSGVDLRGVVMPQAQCGGTSFARAKMEGADFSGANFIDANMQASQMQGSQLTLAAFLRVNISDAVLDDAVLDRARFVRSTCQRTSFQRIRGTRTVWHLSDLQDATLKDSTLVEADMIGANLTGVDMRGASMRAAKLDRTNKEGLKIDSSSVAMLTTANDAYADFVLAST